MTTAPPLPREIQLEVTGACNLRCRMCLVRYRPPLNRIEGSMSFEIFKKIVDELPDLRGITLQGLGEPLLAPDLFRMLEYASARGIACGFNTNATLLTAARAERLVRSGLAWLHVSLDGATKETYEGIRDGATFERVTHNVARLVETKRRLGSATPAVRIIFVAMRRNIHELPAVVRLAAEAGVERVDVQNLSHSFDDTAGAPEYEQIRAFAAEEALWAEPDEATRRVFDEARAEAQARGVRLRIPRVEGPPRPRREGTPGCSWPFDMAYVTHEGKVQSCCMVMGEDRAVLGDVSRDSFRDVWWGEEFQAFRAALYTDEPPEVCRGCSMYRGLF